MTANLEITKFDPKPRRHWHKRVIYKPLFWFEEFLKRMLFDCRSCGQCILSSTGFVCPMRCPKTLRNGPCGGAFDGNCEVDKTKKCVWVEIYENAADLDRVEMLEKFQPPIDHRLEETSSIVNWLDGRVEGMHLAIKGKGPSLVQLVNIAIHLVIYRIKKFFRAPKFWQKQESHYMDV
ncbi:MAG: methylenetetrahydrofolate reductase C-terminal domain-containing protein [Actinobacteria bacterium]|nr:methylenetetrahydrofolate reductase C-terminal domain-containing protein [Actinomycetota bacterium]